MTSFEVGYNLWGCFFLFLYKYLFRLHLKGSVFLLCSSHRWERWRPLWCIPTLACWAMASTFPLMLLKLHFCQKYFLLLPRPDLKFISQPDVSQARPLQQIWAPVPENEVCEINYCFSYLREHCQHALCWLCFSGRPGLLSGEEVLEVSTLESVSIWIQSVEHLGKGTGRDLHLPRPIYDPSETLPIVACLELFHGTLLSR